MSYEHEQFLTTVAQKARTSLAAAEDAARATLQTLAERLSAGRARDLAAQLPPEVAVWLRTNGRPEGFGAEEFVRRVAEREGTDVETATRHACAVQARAVFATLREALPEREFDDVLAQLPRDYAALTARP